MVKLSKKAKCTMTFDQDCSHNFATARDVLVPRAAMFVAFATLMVAMWSPGPVYGASAETGHTPPARSGVRFSYLFYLDQFLE